MLADTDSDCIERLSGEFRDRVARLESRIHMKGQPLEVEPAREGSFAAFDSRHYYILQEGSVTLSSRGRTVCIFEPGEMVLPDVAGILQPDRAVAFTSVEGARALAYPATIFLEEVLSSPETGRMWSGVLEGYGALLTAVCADLAPMDSPEMGGCEMYAPGDVIIRQGDRADDVFNMISGEAEVLVRGIKVGLISQGEIFGTMAALTHSDRSATVKALSDCTVEKVPAGQFSEMIRSNPGTIHSLLVDMANSIVNLDKQLMGLRGPDGAT